MEAFEIDIQIITLCNKKTSMHWLHILMYFVGFFAHPTLLFHLFGLGKKKISNPIFIIFIFSGYFVLLNCMPLNMYFVYKVYCEHS